jgi:hypothetical protein
MARPSKNVSTRCGGGGVCKSRAACGGPCPARGGHERAGRESAPPPTHGGRRARCAHHVHVCLEATMCWEQVSSGSRTRSPAREPGARLSWTESEPAHGQPPPVTPVSVSVDGSIGHPRGHGALSIAANKLVGTVEANHQTWMGGKTNGVDRPKSGDDVPGHHKRLVRRGLSMAVWHAKTHGKPRQHTNGMGPERGLGLPLRPPLLGFWPLEPFLLRVET